jgi:hypothetical protein
MNVHYIPSIKLLATKVHILLYIFFFLKGRGMGYTDAYQLQNNSSFIFPEVWWFYGYFLPGEV